jgi:hypothetical protein
MIKRQKRLTFEIVTESSETFELYFETKKKYYLKYLTCLMIFLVNDTFYLSLGVSICLDVVSIETLDLNVVKE